MEKKHQFSRTAVIVVILLAVIAVLGVQAHNRLAMQASMGAAMATPTPSPTPVPTPEVKKLTTEAELYDALNVPSVEDDITYSGYLPSPSAVEPLNDVIADIHAEGYSCGFVVMDLPTGRTLMYNADTEFYSASTIKAFYVASLADARPELLEEEWPYKMMEAAVMVSDNDAYQELGLTYGQEYLKGWMIHAGVDESKGDWYQDYCARDMARLWVENYWWFDHNETGKKVSSFYESPNMSAIRPLVEEDILTRTKAGWIADIEDDHDLRAANEGGIIYDGEHPYLLSVMTDEPADFEVLGELMQALMDVHADMVKEEG